jgi:O-acetyl-ADP-ribose deacetylase (regulator of RNase III)
MRSILLVAEQNGARRIAIPAISTGVFKYPMGEAAPIIINAILDVRNEVPSIELVRVMLINDADAAYFRLALGL